MQVEDGLPGTWADVEDSAVSLLDFALARDLSSGQMAAADDLRVGTFGFFQSSKMCFGNHQDVCRRLRPDVFKGEHMFIFEDFLGRDFAADDAAEQAVRIQHHPKTIALP